MAEHLLKCLAICPHTFHLNSVSTESRSTYSNKTVNNPIKAVRFVYFTVIDSQILECEAAVQQLIIGLGFFPNLPSSKIPNS